MRAPHDATADTPIQYPPRPKQRARLNLNGTVM